VAVGALHDAVAPQPLEALDGQALIEEPRREEDAARVEALAALRADDEAVALSAHFLDARVAYLDGAIAFEVAPAERTQLERWGAIAGEEVLHVRGARVAACARVEDEDAAPRTAEREGCGQAGRARAEHHDIEECVGHRASLGPSPRSTRAGSRST
jgi:hypothetical protein